VITRQTKILTAVGSDAKKLHVRHRQLAIARAEQLLEALVTMLWNAVSRHFMSPESSSVVSQSNSMLIF
jgi:hypothetical protein